MHQGRRLFATTVLLVASSVSTGRILRAQTATDVPIILEVTWKSDSSGRGVAAGLYAQIEVQEHYQVVSCGGGALPRFETIKDGSTVTGICLKHLDGHIVHAKGHIEAEDELPVYEYRPPMISSAGVPAPGEILTSSDGMIEIILRSEGGNPAGYAGGNSTAESSLGCDVNWFKPRITYEELRNLPTLDRTWEQPGLTDPSMLESCNPGKASMHIRASGSECAALKSACERARKWHQCAQMVLADILGGDISTARAEVSAEHSTQTVQGISSTGWYEQFLITLDQLQSQITKFQGELAGYRGALATACGASPSPGNVKECREDAEKVDELTKSAKESLQRNLERETSFFEASSSPAVASAARVRLLTKLKLQRLIELADCSR